MKKTPIFALAAYAIAMTSAESQDEPAVEAATAADEPAVEAIEVVTPADSQDEPALETVEVGTPGETLPVPQTLTERAGYAYGVVIGTQIKESGIQIDVKQFGRALADIYEENDLVLSDQEIQDAFREAREVADASKGKEGKAFLEENGRNEGVMTTDSGLQYLVLEEGEGENPTASDKVTVHYKGTLIDGTEFDSSYSRGKPASFPLGGVIKGWTEGVQLMKPGGKYRFFIPHELGYGERGAGADIPPYSALIFDIELISVD